MPDDTSGLLDSLHPVVRAHAQLPAPLPFDESNPGAARASLIEQLDQVFIRWGRPAAAVEMERELVIDRPCSVDGGVTARVRSAFYHPEPGQRLGVHVHLHGGGWRTGSIDELCTRHFARRLAREQSVAVATIGYRLAPEHPWPHGLYDVLAGIEALAERSDELGIDLARLTIGGVSAGGNLAAAAVLAGAPARGVVLEVPALDLTGDTLLAGSPDLAIEDLEGVTGTYLSDSAEATDPFVSPLLADDLGNFAPTWLFSAELDPLRFDAEAFARRLHDAGVAVSHRQYAGAFHGSNILAGAWAVAAGWQDDVISAIGAAQAEGTSGDGE